MAVVATPPPAAPTNNGPCQLYIKVLEAKNVKGLDKNGLSDPIVEAYIGTVRRNPLSTKVYNKTVNPQWHEEFIFTLPDQTTPITFHVWDYVRIFPNVSIGTATLDPSTIAPNTAVDLWLPITEGGELHIFAQSTPLTARNPAKGTRLSTFRMILERTVYFPGEVVRGALVFNVGMPLKIRGVRVKFEGFTKTQWSETRGTDRNRRTVWYHSHLVYFNPIATVYGNPRGVKGDLIIGSGGYYWPFEFVLPANCAPSYQHNLGQNSYFVKGYVDIPMGFDRTVTEPLTLTVQYATLMPTLYTKNSSKAKAIFASDQNISVSVTTGPVAYMGEQFEVNMQIVNQGTKAVREVLISLNMKAFFTARSVEGRETRTVRAEIMTHKVAGVAGFPIPPGQTWTGTIRVGIPNKIAPSIPASSSPLIQVFHTIKTRVNTEGNFFTKASNEKKFPVLVGERYPFLQQVVVAPPPQQAQGVIVVAQQPPDVYKYLAPSVMQGETYNPVGNVVPHEVFAQQQVLQCEQWVETVPDSEVYNPSQSYGPTDYSFGGSPSPTPQGYPAQQGYAAQPGQVQRSPSMGHAQGFPAQQGYAAPQGQAGYPVAQPQQVQRSPSMGPAQGYPAQQGYAAPQQQQGVPAHQAYPAMQHSNSQHGFQAPQAAPAQQGYQAPQQGAPAQQGYAAPYGYPSSTGSPAPGAQANPYATAPSNVNPYAPQGATPAQTGYQAPANYPQ